MDGAIMVDDVEKVPVVDVDGSALVEVVGGSRVVVGAATLSSPSVDQAMTAIRTTAATTPATTPNQRSGRFLSEGSSGVTLTHRQTTTAREEFHHTVRDATSATCRAWKLKAQIKRSQAVSPFPD
ncbi:MAG: hypothetical protein ACRDVL_13485 [Acidimicrobiia bacterium]